MSAFPRGKAHLLSRSGAIPSIPQFRFEITTLDAELPGILAIQAQCLGTKLGTVLSEMEKAPAQKCGKCLVLYEMNGADDPD